MSGLSSETIKLVEKITQDYDEQAGTAEHRFDDIKKKMVSMDKFIKDIQEKFKDVESKQIGLTADEFKTYCETQG